MQIGGLKVVHSALLATGVGLWGSLVSHVLV